MNFSVKNLRRTIGLLSLFTLSSCGIQVQPWERGNLAKPHMAVIPNPSREAFREHVFTSKEASQGGGSGVGGGCGCN